MPLSNASRLADFGTGIGTAGAIIQVDNANQRLGVGTTAPTATLGVAGIVSATSFYGDGSNLEGVASAGLGTAVDDTKDSIGQNIYYTNDELTIYENTTIDAPATSDVAYTQYQQVTVESGSELIIADGDTFIPDVLGIGTALQASTAGAGNGLFGTVYADNIENVAGRGGPNFPLGITVAGVSTLSGNVSIGGTLTYEDVTNVDSIGIVTARNGIKVTTGGIDVTAGGATVTAGGITVGSGGINVTGNSTLGGNLNINGPDANNYITLKNTTASDVSNSRSSKIIFQGTRSGGEVSDLVHLSGQHDGGNDNDWGAFRVLVNNGSGVTERFGIGQGGEVRINASIGSAGQVLQSAGGGSPAVWATPSAGAWTVLSHDNFATTNGTTSENRGWTSDYMQVKCVFSYLSCGNATTQGLRCGFYMDTSLGQQGTLDVTGNAYRRTGFPLRFTANSNNLWYNGTDWSWVFGNGNTSLYWSGELIFPIATIVGAGNNVQKYAWGIVNKDNESDRVACEHTDVAKIIVGAKLENTSGNSWTEGRVTWYGLKKS